MRACLIRQHNRLVRLQLLARHHSATHAAAKGNALSNGRAALMTTLTTTSASASTSAAAAAAAAAAASTPPAPQTKSRKPQPPPPTPTVIHRPPLDPALLPVPGEPLCRAALRVLNAPTADLKARLGAEAARMWFAGSLEPPSPENAGLDPPAPERPARDDAAVTIVPPQRVKRLKAGGTPSSRLAILHALCHIESWAIDLSWDIIARFGRDPSVSAHLPRAFFDDFVRVADDEGKHFLALRDRLEALGSRYGAFEAHDALWHSAAETAHSLPARLAVEHAVHEARGLDVMPSTLHKMRLDPESQALLRDLIYPEEITHCAAGVRWLRHLHEVARRAKEAGAKEEEEEEEAETATATATATAAEEPSGTGAASRFSSSSSSSSSSSPSTTTPPAWMAEAQRHETVQTWFHELVRRHFAGSLKPPFNDEARAAAGFDESWYLPLALDDERRRREQAERGRSEAAASAAAAAASAAAASAAAEKEKEEEEEVAKGIESITV